MNQKKIIVHVLFLFLGMKIEQIQAIIQDNGICSLVGRSDESVVQSWFRQVSIFKPGDDQVSRTGCLHQRL